MNSQLGGCRSALLTIISVSAFAWLLAGGRTRAQAVTPPPVDPAVTAIWRNPDAPIPERVKALMSQLAMKEKISLIYFLAPAIDRLGIREYNNGNECLHGLVRPGSFTVFPQAIGLGATFDPALVHTMASAISDEARAKWNMTGGQHLGRYSDVLTLWSPVVNMARDPRWGRTQETYGEDPWLTSRLGVSFVRGLQGDDPHYLKVIATPKHFAGNNQEHGRMGLNILADERYLQEYELAGFRACITEGKAESIMAAYTAINGVPCSANKWLLTDVLRGKWGFQGYVVSDCGAVSHVVDAHHYVNTPAEAAAACLNAGLDMEGGLFAQYPDVVDNYLQPALDQGLVKPEVVDNALALVLTGRFKLGMYDPPARVPYSTIPASVIRSPEHIALARKLADESMVLLRNAPVDSASLLPIDPTRTKKVVVVGPNADTVQLGDYSGTPTDPVTPLAGLQARAQSAGMTLAAIPWQSDKSEVVPSNVLTPDPAHGSTTGLTGQYFNSADLTGSPDAIRTDPQLDFDWAHAAPDPLANGQQFSVRWSGRLMTAIPGVYTFSVNGDGGYRLFIDGEKVLDSWGDKSQTRQVRTWKSGPFTPGNHAVKLEYHHNGGETGLILSWIAPADQKNLEPVKDADLVIAVMGITANDESENRDRATLHLPFEQEEFIKKVVSENPRTVLVLESGSPLAVPWAADHVPAIVQAWYPGQEGGHAIADILFGDANPSGRLPLTFYADDSQLRPMDEYELTKGRTYMYLRDKPLYPFGYGLSYTTFKYANLKVSPNLGSAHDQITAAVDVTNTGTRDGDEVVQCYVHAQKASVPMPIKQLWAFQRVSLQAGQTKTVSLSLDSKNFGHWDKASQRFIVEPGQFDILVGASSDDIRSTQVLRIDR
jgi:beta-glucosidase